MFGPRQLDMVGDGRIIGLVPAVPDDSTRVIEEAIRMLNTLERFRDRFGATVILICKAIDLIAIENCICLQEWDIALDLSAARIGFGFGEAAGIDDGRAALALAHVSAEFVCLAQRHPCGRPVTTGDALRPEKENIEAGVRLSVVTKRSAHAAR